MLDRLDVALIEALTDHPRVGDLELSRLLGVARATVQARLRKLEEAGVITGYGPDLDLAAAGHAVLAFVTLEIVQGAIDQVAAELASIPQVLEAHITSGTADILCKVAASSHDDLKDVLLRLSRADSVARTSSVIVLSEIVAPRVLPLLAASAVSPAPRAPAFRS